jgi:sulfur relay (sulfurtransferase) DsrC/TusE family protein
MVLNSVAIRQSPIRIRRRISVVFGYPSFRISVHTDKTDHGYPWRITRIIRFYYNSGQICSAGQNLIPAKKIFAKFVLHKCDTTFIIWANTMNLARFKIQRISEVIPSRISVISDIRHTDKTDHGYPKMTDDGWRIIRGLQHYYSARTLSNSCFLL